MSDKSDRTPEIQAAAADFFAHPELWPYAYEGGRRGAFIRRPVRRDDGTPDVETRHVYSDDPDLRELAARGWEAD